MAGERILADIVRRSGGRLLDLAVDRALPKEVSAKVAKKSLLGGVAGALAVRLATRSVPGAIVVSGGLLAKRLYDRRRAKRNAASPPEPQS